MAGWGGCQDGPEPNPEEARPAVRREDGCRSGEAAGGQGWTVAAMRMGQREVLPSMAPRGIQQPHQAGPLSWGSRWPSKPGRFPGSH